jgi:hypothetical protein
VPSSTLFDVLSMGSLGSREGWFVAGARWVLSLADAPWASGGVEASSLFDYAAPRWPAFSPREPCAPVDP